VSCSRVAGSDAGHGDGQRGNAEVKKAVIIALLTVGIASFAVVFYIGNYGVSLARAAAVGDLQETMRILEKHPQMLNSNPDGSSPLHYAAANGHTAVVRYLVEQGADTARGNERDLTPEQWARQNGHTETADYLSKTTEGKREQAQEPYPAD